MNRQEPGGAIVPASRPAVTEIETPPDRPPFQLTGLFTIVLIGALYFAREFFLPIFIAVLVYLTLSPVVRWAGRRGVPPVVSAIILVIAMVAGLILLISIASDPVASMIANGPATIDLLREKFHGLRRPLEALVQFGSKLDEVAGPTAQAKPREVVVSQPGILSIAVGTLTGALTMAGAALVLIVFLLSSGDLFLQKLVRVLPTMSDKKRWLRIVHDVQGEVSRYLLTITLINSGLGVVIGLTMAMLGMPNPVLWGIAAAILNFIPYVGALIGFVTAAVVAAVTFNLPFDILLPPLSYIALHTLESAFITPMILGRRLEVNTVAIVVSLVFWGWMWGIVGALIAVPILVTLKAFCDHFERLTVLGEFLSGAPPAAEPAANGGTAPASIPAKNATPPRP